MTSDVVDILTSDHRDVTALIGEIWTIRDPLMRRDLTDTAISELVRHAVAEEMYVYPAMKKYLPDGEKAVEHDVEEHKELEEAMKSLPDPPAPGRSQQRAVPQARRPGGGPGRPPARQAHRPGHEVAVSRPGPCGPASRRGPGRDRRRGRRTAASRRRRGSPS
uniref:hemerythrin domain-containing protein n=1 Tax=Paractinoplanes polyasparticus TaxID=2856853 RepID=UPI002107BE40|nr:hemerythrin domain-containing protein [Actinoplanes polyasparticus]